MPTSRLFVLVRPCVVVGDRRGVGREGGREREGEARATLSPPMLLKRTPSESNTWSLYVVTTYILNY